MVQLDRCVIITSYQSASLKEFFTFRETDYIICADRGYSHARAEGISPDVVIGDFDSIPRDEVAADIEKSGLGSCCSIVGVPPEKDDTDTLICLKYGMERGFDEFFILGGLGGRLDHTMANLQTMSHAVDHQKAIWFLDGKNRATLRNPGEITIRNPEWPTEAGPSAPGPGAERISLFAFGDFCDGVSIRGVKYPLENYRMNNSFPIGVSNEFAGEAAEISHTAGKLLIILSRD